jgi:S1-C subfamily serine protease
VPRSACSSHETGRSGAFRRTNRLGGRRALIAYALLVIAAFRSVSRTSASDPAEAIVFLRVFGDVQAEFTRPWRQAFVREDVEIATGSGFVIAPSGLILTSHHVVEGKTTAVRIEGEDARMTTIVKRIEAVVGGEAPQSFESWVAAKDAGLDLAVLRVNASDLAYLPFGDSDAAETGSRTRVLGFPFGRRLEVGRQPAADVMPEVTVTAGSLSAARADEQGDTRFLQTDASVHPGNSGGPMVDEEGYAIGVVRMKFSPGRSEAGPGFSVPINLVKDFLDDNGLGEQLPTARLRRGVVHGLDWKMLGLELPDGFADESPTRLRLDTGASGGVFSVRVERVVTPWTIAALEEALLQAKGLPDFVPAPAAVGRRVERARPTRVLGTAAGMTADGGPFRLEYALLDLGREKVVARYLAPPDDMAFNLSVVRRSLEQLEAKHLLTDEVRTPLGASFEPIPYAGAATGAIPFPAGWISEPAAEATCEEVGTAEAGLSASPPGDFTVVLRALRFARGAIAPGVLAQTCGGSGATASSYAQRFRRLGVDYGAQGVFVPHGEETLLLEVEAPEAKLGFVRELFEIWARRVAEGS